MKERFVLFALSIIIISVSCNKHVSDRASRIPPVNVPDKSAWIAGLNKEVASVLEEVYRNDSAYREVNAAIFSEYYIDERVLLQDLLFPETSSLYSNEKFKKFKAAAGVFSRIFLMVAENGNYPLLKSALDKETAKAVIAKPDVLGNSLTVAGTESIFSGNTAVAIYFPYSLNYSSTGMTSAAGLQRIAPATIVAADREADSGPGKQPVACSAGSGSVCYKQVTVDDNYANLLPVHIVTNGARPRPVDAIDDVPVTVAMSRVYLGNARLTRQMDALISFTGNGGGSEIKVARLDGYLKKESEQVTSFAGDVVSLDYSRSDIKNQKWKRVYSIWDANWKKDNLQQVFAVYEDDTKGTKTFSGSLSTTIGKSTGTKGQGELSFKIEVSTQDDIITQRKIDRVTFYGDGRNNQGFGFFKDPSDFLAVNTDWPIYDGGTIWQYTMPWKNN